MTKKLEVLAKARDLQPRLAAAADNLNAKIAEFEKALGSLKLGVVASVQLSGESESFGEYLRFAKWRDAWRLVVVEVDFHADVNFELLQNKSRETRLAAVALFPSLIEELLRSAEREIERVAASATAIDDLIKQVEKSS
ncbi:MAG: hypothetical protein Q8N26_01200 [Myxococcales bacterium]|nr:hypothetical protein [Myxococcales bacterium]